MPKRLPTPLNTLIAYAADRFMALAHPDRGEPSPVAEGATIEIWAELGGLTGLVPHDVIWQRHHQPLDLERYDVATVADTTLRRLCRRGVVERVGGGFPKQYRPRRAPPKE